MGQKIILVMLFIFFFYLMFVVEKNTTEIKELKKDVCRLYCLEGIEKIETNITLSECLVSCGVK